VLLAEADPGNAECMSLLLEVQGHRVRVARDGPSALRLAQADPPDVVLLEIRLPCLDGWEVARRLREQSLGRRPFCIAVTSCSTDEDRRRSLEVGIDLHLVKPVENRFLQAVLRRFQALIEPVESGDSLDAGWSSPRRDASLALC
jgi:CheY-like chemotaxis protein